MNKNLLVLNIVLLLAVAVLFYLVLGKTAKDGDPAGTENRDSLANDQGFRLAYFDMDSIETNFSMFKEMQKEVGKKEDSMNSVLNSAKMNFQGKYQKFMEQRASMTPEQLEQAGKELQQMDLEIKNKENTLGQTFQSYYMNKQQEVIASIKKYCLEFNKGKKYSFIIANEPGLVYFKDTAYNVTSELIKGLNEFYSKQKKN